MGQNFDVGLGLGDMSPEDAELFARRFGLLGLKTEMPVNTVMQVLDQYEDGATKDRLLAIINARTHSGGAGLINEIRSSQSG